MINITIVITSEICIDGKYNQSLLLEKLKKPVTQCTYNLAYIMLSKLVMKNIIVYMERFFFLTNKLCACVKLHLTC